MRLNKYVPFLIAVALHLLPVTALLLLKKSEDSPVRREEFHGIDLAGFSTTPKKSAAGAKSSFDDKIAKTEPAMHSTSGIEANEGSPTGTVAAANGTQSPSRILSMVEPLYPPLARQKGYEGIVTLRAHYDEQGEVTSIDLLNSSGVKMLDESAKKALLAWKLKSGRAGAFEKTFQFKLNN